MENNKISEEELKKRQDRFKKLGLPSGAGTMMDNSVVQGATNTNKFSKLEELKRGAQKNVFKKFINAAEKSNAAKGVQIPESKQKTNPNDPNAHKVRAEHVVDVEGFAPEGGGSEFQMLENMMGGSGGGRISTTSPQTADAPLDIDNVNAGMPSFDPIAHLRQQGGVEPQQQQQQTQTVLQEQETVASNSTMKVMMQQIAQEVSENTIRKVLKEYMDIQNPQNTLEIYDANRNLIKVGEQMYQISSVSPLKLTKVRLVNK